MNEKIALIAVVIMLAAMNTAKAGFPDQDKDGVHDENDRCPDTTTIQADASGCSCEQKTNPACTGEFCCKDDNNPCTDICIVRDFKAVCNTPNDNNTCGIERKCQKDACSLGLWHDFPESGIDYCSSGECVSYNCWPEKTPKEDCRAGCSGAYFYDPETQILKLDYKCLADTITFEFSAPIQNESYGIINESIEVKEEEINGNTLLIALDTNDTAAKGNGSILEIRLPEEPRIVKIDNKMIQKSTKKEFKIDFIFLGTGLLMLLALTVVSRMAYEYRRDKKMLTEFIHQQLGKGHAASNVRDALLKHGWSPRMVEKALEKTIKSFIKR